MKHWLCLLQPEHPFRASHNAPGSLHCGANGLNHGLLENSNSSKAQSVVINICHSTSLHILCRVSFRIFVKRGGKCNSYRAKGGEDYSNTSNAFSLARNIIELIDILNALYANINTLVVLEREFFWVQFLVHCLTKVWTNYRMPTKWSKGIY